MTESLSVASATQAKTDTGIVDSLHRVAEVRGSLLRLITGMTDPQAHYATRPDTWSAAQILDHLLLSDALYRAQFRRLLDMAAEGRRNNLTVGFAEVDLDVPFIPKALVPAMEIPLTLLNMFIPHVVRETLLRYPIVKATHPKITDPAPARPITALRGELVSSLAETESLLKEPLPVNAERVTLSHPVFGCNTIANLLRLMAAHEQRHIGQIASLLRQPGFPAGDAL